MSLTLQSFDHDVVVPDQSRELFVFAPDELPEVIAASGEHHHAQVFQPPLHLLKSQDFAKVLVQTLLQGRIQPSGRQDAPPCHQFEPLDSGLRQRWHVRQRRRTLLRRHTQCTDLPRPDKRKGSGGGVKHGIQAPGHQVRVGGACALIGHVLHLNARHALEQLHRQVGRGPLAAGAVAEFPGLRSGCI